MSTIEIINTSQYNSHCVKLELIVNETTNLDREIFKEDIFKYLDYTIDLGEGDSIHYKEFKDDEVDYIEFTEEELTDYITNN